MVFTKISEDDIVAGLQFAASGSDGSYKVFTSDASGNIDVSSLEPYEKIPVLDEDGKPVVDDEGNPVTQQGPAIVYTLQEINVPDRYVIPAPSAPFTVVGGSINFTNAAALKALYDARNATMRALHGTSDPLEIIYDNLENANATVFKDGRMAVSFLDKNGSPLGVNAALEVTCGQQILYGYTDEKGFAYFAGIDVEAAKKGPNTIQVIGYIEAGNFVPTEEYRAKSNGAGLQFTKQGAYFC